MEQLIYIADGFWREMGDQRVHSNYPMMSGGPIPIIAIVSAYVYFIRVLGPRYMKGRDAYDLKWTIRFYNIAMSLVNLYIFYRTSVLTKFGLSYFGCRKVGTGREDDQLVSVAFLYFASKLVELLDTVFFILRKKYNQASNLHVFHHSFIAVCVWIYFKVAPGGSSVLFPYLNTGVHTVMYGYYFLATFKHMQKHLWWKRYLTLVQIVQFVLSMVHFSFQGLSSCEYPAALAMIGFFFNFVFFALFCDFYYHAYTKSSNRATQQQQPQAKIANNVRHQAQQQASKRKIVDENNNNNDDDKLENKNNCSANLTQTRQRLQTRAVVVG